MKRVFLLLLPVLAFSFLTGGRAEAIVASPGACFVMRGGAPLVGPNTGLQRTSCDTYKAVYPTFNYNSSKCYIADGRSGAAIKIPAEVSCQDIPDQTNDNIPVGTLPAPTPTGANSKPFVPDECATNNKATSCANIPVGCPGSSVQGPVLNVDPSKCPYAVNPSAPAQTASPVSVPSSLQPAAIGECGEGDKTVRTSINLGCTRTGNPILDLLFAVIRFLTIGVGIVLIGSMIVGGLQYTASMGDPQAVAKAKTRILSVLGALVLYLLIFALLQFLVPGGVFR